MANYDIRTGLKYLVFIYMNEKYTDYFKFILIIC